MSNKEVIGRVKNITNTQSTWESINPILLQGEIGVESDTNRLKVGDGVTNWATLTYIGGSSDMTPLTDAEIEEIVV